MKRVSLLVHGHVQGVWYRASTQQVAERLRLVGWVRNRADGKVEAVAEGHETSLGELIEWCHAGPPAARVEKVDVTWDDATSEFQSFTIR